VKGSVIPIVDFTAVCEGWMVFVLVGVLILLLAGLFFLGYLSKYGADAGMAVRTVSLYVVIYCVFTVSLRCCLYHCAEMRLCMGP
jgi:uncharacterized membrane protein